ncbi:hypothetical protein OCH239_11930 [Roseivivax halodurans JCM 10272]|uniref:Uncharacterized protein n=1 Tax=Roseivivax halodurans JCM 10272 TaxID=1449350 RepID=X7EJB0_9RHOB|nr:hypothetical protein [Roseivivax halodurans]ETX15950.1 hypothetical protein OCH239_11930 [Roseivivax halodurans JCM 10272]
MTLSLYALRHGGFAVSWCDRDGMFGAARSEVLEDAMSVIEELCRDQTASQFDIGMGPAGVDGVVEALSQLHRRQTDTDAFLALAGLALDDWDAWGRNAAAIDDAGD